LYSPIGGLKIRGDREMFATYAKTRGAHGLGSEWIRVCIGTREMCEATAALWAATGHTVEVDAL
jgi:hypothetical protein